MEQGCWCTLEGAYFPFVHAGMVRPLAEAGVEWWHNHFLSIDYGYGKSSSSVGLYVRGPAEVRPKMEIQGLDSRLLEDAPVFPEGRIRKIGELVVPHVPAYELAEMVIEAFVKPDENGQRRRIVAAYLDPANFKDIGDGHTIADQLNEVFDPWEITCERASNDRIGGWQLLYRMLRTGEFELTDVCPRSFEALRTRMHDDARPGDIRKIAGDPLDDVADETGTLCTRLSNRQPSHGNWCCSSGARVRCGLGRHSLAIKGGTAGPGRSPHRNDHAHGIEMAEQTAMS